MVDQHFVSAFELKCKTIPPIYHPIFTDLTQLDIANLVLFCWCVAPFDQPHPFLPTSDHFSWPHIKPEQLPRTPGLESFLKTRT